MFCLSQTSLRVRIVAVATLLSITLPWADSTLLASVAAQTSQPGRTFVVNATSDETDATPGNDVCETANGNSICTLRAAINEAIAKPGHDVINFDIRTNGSCPALATITHTSDLTINDPTGDGVTIDGYTQCDASVNTLNVGSNAAIKIEIKGAGEVFSDGLIVNSANNVVRGLAIYNWAYQVRISGANAANNQIEGNFIGTDATTTAIAPESGIRTIGVYLNEGARDNVVGGTTPATRNIITGSRETGVYLAGDNVVRNRVIGNYLGLKRDGLTRFFGNGDNVDIDCGPQYNLIGGLNPGEGNILAGDADGVEISHCKTTRYNAVLGNWIGMNARGDAVAPGAGSGVTIEDNAGATTIRGNVIGNMGSNGIRLSGANNNNVIQYNRIGVKPDGVTPLPNGQDPTGTRGKHGINIRGGSRYNIVTNNLIANNPDHGIYMENILLPSHDTDEPPDGQPGDGFSEAKFNTISKNSIYNNGRKGIFLKSDEYPSGSGTQVYPNEGLRAPSLMSATTATLAGTAQTRTNAACANCRIEVFIAAANTGELDGEGRYFVAEGVTDAAGNFSIGVCGKLAQGQSVTATTTDGAGNTSYFALNRVVAAGACTITPPPTPPLTYLPPQAWLPLGIK